MDVMTTTPFGQRPVTAGLLKRTKDAQRAASVPHLDKWALFRDLCTARAAYGVTDRDLGVLNALLSFHPEKTLSDNDGLVVFPSNRALSERAHGMAESTLRRHLAALVQSGLIQRHDSPNGKRYAARGAGGEVLRAFGFDLRPLLIHAADIVAHAEEARATQARQRALREQVSLLKRDALKLSQYGQESATEGDWGATELILLDIHKRTRRKLSEAELTDLKEELSRLLRHIRTMLETKEMSGRGVNSERHHQNSNKDSSVFEPCLEKAGGKGGEPEPTTRCEENEDQAKQQQADKTPTLPLQLVLKACPDILPYSDQEVRHWNQLVNLAAFVRGMMGISLDAWRRAERAMGPEVAAVTVAGILQRVSDIRNPGGYLRSLTAKAEEGAFSPAPMIMALLNAERS